MYDLTHFGLKEITVCGAALPDLGHGADSMEDVAERIVRHLYDGMSEGPSSPRACALVRFYKTHGCEALEPQLLARLEPELERVRDAAVETIAAGTPA